MCRVGVAERLLREEAEKGNPSVARAFVSSLLCLCCVGCFRAAARDPAEAAKRLEGQWQQIQRKRPNLGVRSVFSLALEAAAVGWHP